MSGLEKIIEQIEKSAAETAEKTLEDAKAEAAKIKASGKEIADAKEVEIKKQCEMDIAATSKRIQSAAEQQEKRLFLQSKQVEIELILNLAVERLNSLDDDAYFETILKMIPKYAQSIDGKIKFSQKDLDRLPAGFEEKANQALNGKAKLTLSNEAVNISGGFILDYGDIEENCSFEALIEDSKGRLQDEIGQIMFVE